MADTFSLPANARRLDDALLPDEWYIRSLVLEMGAHLGMVSGYQGSYLASGIPAVIGQAKFGQLPVTLVRDPGEEETMNLDKGAPRPSIIDEKNGSMPALPVPPGKAGRNGSRAFSFASQ